MRPHDHRAATIPVTMTTSAHALAATITVAHLHTASAITIGIAVAISTHAHFRAAASAHILRRSGRERRRGEGEHESRQDSNLHMATPMMTVNTTFDADQPGARAIVSDPAREPPSSSAVSIRHEERTCQTRHRNRSRFPRQIHPSFRTRNRRSKSLQHRVPRHLCRRRKSPRRFLRERRRSLDHPLPRQCNGHTSSSPRSSSFADSTTDL